MSRFTVYFRCHVLFVVAMCLLLLATAPRTFAATPQSPEVLTLGAAAELLQIESEELLRSVELGQVPGRRIGANWRFSRTALLAWLAGSDHPETEILEQYCPEASISNLLASEHVMEEPDLGRIKAMGTTRETPQKDASEPGVIGERPETDTAAQAFLREQQVLMGKGELGLELGVFYSKSEDQELIFTDPVLGLGSLVDKGFSMDLAARYGISRRLQLFGSIPWQQRQVELTWNDPLTGHPNTNSLDDRSEWGDLTLGGRWTAVQEDSIFPEVILSLESRVPTGDSSYALGAGIALVRSIDPMVLFGNFNALHTYSRYFEDASRLQPENTLSASLGYALALNDSLTLSNSLTGIFTRRTTFEHATLPAQERFILQFGLTSKLTRDLFIEPSLAFDISGTGSNYSIGVRLPYTFGP